MRSFWHTVKKSIGLHSFSDSLWWNLTITYTVVSVIGMLFILATFDVVTGYGNYKKITAPSFVLQTVQNTLRPYREIPLGALSSQLNLIIQSVEKSVENLEMPLSSPEVYRLNLSCSPDVAVIIFDRSKRIIKDLGDKNLTAKFLQSQDFLYSFNELGGHILESDVHTSFSITPINNDLSLVVLLRSYFSLWLQIKSSVTWLIDSIGMFFVVSFIVAIFCGLFAARPITRRLSHIAEVTSSWSEGKLDTKIIECGNDELSTHSRNLNIMAEQLKDYLNLRTRNSIKEERARMAVQLHDTVKQNLFALALQIKAIESKAGTVVVNHLAEAKQIIKECQIGLENVISELRISYPPVIDIAHELESIKSEYLNRYNLKIELLLRVNNAIQSEILNEVLLIIRESLNNAVRHGKAHEAIITLTLEQDKKRVTIYDNGIGFDTTKNSVGMGLTTMSRRARKLNNGSLIINSIPQQGTSIEISWT